MITKISLVTICYHTKLYSNIYYLFCYTLQPMNCLCYNLKFVPLNPLSLFYPCFNPPPSGKYLFVSCNYESVFWGCFGLFCILDYTYINKAL